MADLRIDDIARRQKWCAKRIIDRPPSGDPPKLVQEHRTLILEDVPWLLEELQRAQDGWDACSELLEASGADFQDAERRAREAEARRG